MLSTAISRWWHQLWCLHTNQYLVTLVGSDDMMGGRMRHYCPTCDKDWTSNRIFVSFLREGPLS